MLKGELIMRNCGYDFWENEDCRAESCRGGDERGHWDGNCCCGRTAEVRAQYAALKGEKAE